MASDKKTSKGSGSRELINTGTDKRYVRRDTKGRFEESDDVGRSLAQDVRKHAKTEAKSGQGDHGDQKRSSHGSHRRGDVGGHSLAQDAKQHSKTSVKSGQVGRYVRRDSAGRFEESDDVGRSLSQANKHMERAWDKIYDRESNGRAASRKH
jgi:hypothetical protein